MPSTAGCTSPGRARSSPSFTSRTGGSSRPGESAGATVTLFLIRRSAAALLLLFLVLTVTFFLVHLAPGDPASLFDNGHMTAAQHAHLLHLYGLDRPLPVQYFDWLGAALRGEWGTSFEAQL